MDRFSRVLALCAVGSALAVLVLLSRRKRSARPQTEQPGNNNNLNQASPASQPERNLPGPKEAVDSKHQSEEFTIRGLFGGAIQCLIPSRCSDIEQFRQVPDHQVVFEDSEIDQSIIIEVNTFQDAVSDADCAMFFWKDLLDTESAKEVSSPELFTPVCAHISPEHFKCGLVGIQQVSKYRDDATNTVQVCMAIIRLKRYASDICVFVNTPLRTSNNSSTPGLPACSEALGPEVLTKVLNSFEIKDYSLF